MENEMEFNCHIACYNFAFCGNVFLVPRETQQYIIDLDRLTEQLLCLHEGPLLSSKIKLENNLAFLYSNIVLLLNP